MSDLINSMMVSSSGMKAQATRLRHVAENIANVDTPGYRRKTVAFQTEYGGDQGLSLVDTGRVRLDRSDLQLIYDPSHPLADETGHFNGSNVKLTVEIADSREAQRGYEANLKLFDQARKMSGALLELLKR